MKKVKIDLGTDGCLYFNGLLLYSCPQDMVAQLEEVQETDEKLVAALEFSRMGYSAEDLIDMKRQGIL